MSSDYAISPTPYAPAQPAKYSHTPYLIVLSSEDQSIKAKKTQKFITTGKLDTGNSFVSIKGFFCDENEDVICAKYSELLKDVNKEKIVDIFFPIYRIIYIRSLVYTGQR